MQHVSQWVPAGRTSEPEVSVFVGSARATPGERVLAGAVAGALLLSFGLSIPYATLALPHFPAFVPMYDVAVIVLDVITACWLHAQYRERGEPSLLALACAYTFTPILMLAHAVSFPDTFVAGSAIGNSQTTAWLWVCWHGLFPLFVAAYAAIAPRPTAPAAQRSPSPVAQRWAFSGTLGAALAAVVFAVRGSSSLPALMVDVRYHQRMRDMLALSWLAHLVACGVLVARTRLRRRLDLWVAITLLAWLLDLALSAVLATGRYQLGFYLGRLYGLLGSSVVLAILLHETLELYRAAVGSARNLASAGLALRESNDTLEACVLERAAALEVEMRERRALALQLATTHEEERKRFARELHDSIGQLAAGLTFTFKTIEHSGELPPAAREALIEARRLADMLGKEVHELAVRLRPTALDEMGLDAALDQLVAQWSTRTGVATDYATVGLENSRFATEVETCVYRVVQEALTNIAKYARASRVGVVVTRPGGGLSVVIEDDGTGFDPGSVPGERLGLLGMRERAALVGGTLTIESSADAGTTLTLRIPAPLEAPGEPAPASSGPEARADADRDPGRAAEDSLS
jgi:two-component system, NarL family, sensor histidine kinase UhpB